MYRIHATGILHYTVQYYPLKKTFVFIILSVRDFLPLFDLVGSTSG